MRLLLLTQSVDRNDTVLGFMHEWLREFSKHFEHITVIALRKGDYFLPKNVEVLSLGKEDGKTRLTRLWRFYRYISSLRGQYDGVFVHMNPEYVILGGLLWRLWGKRVALWYNHARGGARLSLAMRLADEVFHTSPYAASAGTAKSRRMPVGIDTSVFAVRRPRIASKTRSILSLGRVAPIKHLEVILDAVIRLVREKEPVRFSIVGDALAKHAAYLDSLKVRAHTITGNITFLSGIADRNKVVGLFGLSDFFVNASPSGLFDKTVFEAMACGCIPLVSSKAFADVLPQECLFREGNSRDLAERLKVFFKMPLSRLETLRKSLRESVVREHSLTRLAALIAERMGVKR